MKQDNLRQQVKHLKANGVSYREIADGIGINQSSFYSWKDGEYNFKDDTAECLEQWILDKLLEQTPRGRKYKTVRNLVNLLEQYDFDDDEILKQLPQYDKNVRYYASNKGNIFSLCGKEWRKKIPQIDKDGYLYIDLYEDGERTRKRVHQLVVEAFLPDVNLTDNEIHHLDGNKQNNELSNLLPVDREQHAKIHKLLNKWSELQK